MTSVHVCGGVGCGEGGGCGEGSGRGEGRLYVFKLSSGGAHGVAHVECALHE